MDIEKGYHSTGVQQGVLIPKEETIEAPKGHREIQLPPRKGEGIYVLKVPDSLTDQEIDAISGLWEQACARGVILLGAEFDLRWVGAPERRGDGNEHGRGDEPEGHGGRR